MRRIALINQKGGVGKTTSSVNLGAALARAGRRVVLIDLDPQANLSMHLDVQLKSGDASTYSVLLGDTPIERALRETTTPNLRLIASSIDLSGAELELANSFGREMVLRDALDVWEKEHREGHGEAPADYVLLDCPPSLGLLAINGLVAAGEAVIAVQTEFFALQGMTKLVDVVGLLRRRLNPKLEITGILPCLYDSRTKLAREVLGELRSYFPGKVFQRAIAKNVKLAEAPSYGRTIFDYAPGSGAALDYELVAQEMLAQEARDPDLAERSPAIVEPVAVIEPAPFVGRESTARAKRGAPAAEDAPLDAAPADAVPTGSVPAHAVPAESVPTDGDAPDPPAAGEVRVPSAVTTGPAREPRPESAWTGATLASSESALETCVGTAVVDPPVPEAPLRNGLAHRFRDVVLDPFPRATTALEPAKLAEAALADEGLADEGLANEGLANEGLANGGLADGGLEDLPDLPPDAILLGRLED